VSGLREALQMKARALGAIAALLFPAIALAQNARPATYITAEQVQMINKLPGTDRQIVNVDVGNTNLAVGVIHRGRTGAPPTAAAGGGAAAAGRGGAPAGGGAAAGGGAPAAGAAANATPPEPCGEKGTPPAGSATGLWHQGQTETYIIISGSGTLVTGGKIMNGRKSGPTSEVTRVLNGPSCSGTIVGDDVVKRVVNVGDIIIIPAGTPHGWTEIGDHVDYLSVRPDPQRTIPDLYTHPALKKQ
jgi:mannose-6-phosphate isomerase-like protein (cupin superfamily)